MQSPGIRSAVIAWFKFLGVNFRPGFRPSRWSSELEGV